MIKKSSRIRKNTDGNKTNSSLPTKVTTLENGEYECNIVEITQQETKYGKAIVIKLESQVIARKVFFYKYFNIDQGIISGSEFYIFLDSMNALRKDNITWSKIRGASVIATLEVGDDAKIKVKKLTPANSDSTDESAEYFEEYEEYDEEDMEDEEDDDEEE